MKCSSISASTIKTYMTCPFKLYMQKQLGVDLGTNFGAKQGTLVHDIFEKFGRARRDKIDHPEIERKWVDMVLASYAGPSGIWSLSKKAIERTKKCDGCSYNNNNNCFITNMSIKDKDFEGCPIGEFKDALNLVELVVNDPTPQSPLSKKVVDVENKFVIRIWDHETEEEIPVIGYIDVVTEIDDDTVEIWDYKTGKYIQNYKQCAKDPQLLIYHLAGRYLYPQYKNLIVTIYYMRKSPISLSFNKRDEHGTVKAIKYYWQTIRNDITPQRRADLPGGITRFDYKCKNLCKPEICKNIHKQFMADGGIIWDNEQEAYEDKTNYHQE